MKYVRRPTSDTWHFCTNCAHYPHDREVVTTTQAETPTSGELCNQCLAKQRRGGCLEAKA